MIWFWTLLGVVAFLVYGLIAALILRAMLRGAGGKDDS